MDLPEPSPIEPDEEQLHPEQDLEGTVLKLSFNIHMFMNHEKSRYFMITTDQKMVPEGQMTLKEAMTKFNKKPRRKRS